MNNKDFIFFSKNCNFDFNDNHKFVTVNEFDGFNTGIVVNSYLECMFVKIKHTGIKGLSKFNNIIENHLHGLNVIRFIKIPLNCPDCKEMVRLLSYLYNFDIYEYTHDGGVILKLND